MSEHLSPELLSLTANIVSAHISKNAVQADALPALIKSVHNALKNVGTVEPEPAKLEPAVPIKRSVFPDYIVCLEDGRKLKMLKRHLQTTYNLSPAQYRERWGLPHDYPMVAPSYASRRSELAKTIGLGRRAAPKSAEVPVKQFPAKKRGRKPSAKAAA